MKTGLGLAMASSLLIAAGACAGGGTTGGGGGGVAPTPPPTEGVETVDPGESPRNNEFTAAADENLEQAQVAIEEGNAQEAQTLFRQAVDAADQAISMDARNPLPWLQGGRANIGLDNYEVADSMLARAEELRPLYEFDITAIREQAWIELYDEATPLVNSGDYAAAAEIYEQAHAIYRGRPEVMLTLGQIWAQQGQYDEAVEILRQAQEMIQSEEVREPMDSAAIAAWDEQAEQVRPVIAQSLMNAGRLEEGAEELRQLVADYPEDLVYKRNLAQVYIQMELPDSATAIYDELLAGGNLDADALYQVGVGFYQLGNPAEGAVAQGYYERAAEAFKQAVERAPRDRDAAEMWARTMQLAHPRSEPETTPEPVLRELREAAATWVELDSHSQPAHTVLAQTELRLGNEEAANEVVSRFEDITVLVDNLRLRRMLGGGATVTGELRNTAAEQGTQVTMEVTFYGESGATVGTGSQTIQLPAVDAAQTFEVVLESDQPIFGYTYELQGV